MSGHGTQELSGPEVPEVDRTLISRRREKGAVRGKFGVEKDVEVGALPYRLPDETALRFEDDRFAL